MGARTVGRATRRMSYLGYVRATRCSVWIADRGSWPWWGNAGAINVVMMVLMVVVVTEAGQGRNRTQQDKDRNGARNRGDKRKKRKEGGPLDGDEM